jgi:hypothetical protein
VTAVRTLFAQLSHSRLTGELLATRGDRLALIRAHWTTGGGAVGPSEIVWLQLIETDTDGPGRRRGVVRPDDRDAAYDEIDARFAAGEGAPHAEFLTAFSDYRRASAARDWETVARLLPEGLHAREPSAPRGLGGADRGGRSTSRRAGASTTSGCRALQAARSSPAPHGHLPRWR